MRRHNRSKDRQLIRQNLLTLDEERRLEAKEQAAENAQIYADVQWALDSLGVDDENLSRWGLDSPYDNFDHDPYDDMAYDRHEEEDELRFYGDTTMFGDW